MTGKSGEAARRAAYFVTIPAAAPISDENPVPAARPAPGSESYQPQRPNS
ncbi:hypothetical protein [Burkholderia plantarii]|nr:hypothetical protein [Burkholderia plantarii]